MVGRAGDWLRQAERDLEHARSAAEHGHDDWACFAAQQAAEKALKAVVQSLGGEARGHAAHRLLDVLPARIRDEANEVGLPADARELDRHYIPSRYPNSIPAGAPFEVYDADQSGRALAAADRIVRFCQRHMARQGGGA